jgi:hypothetical protein
MPECFHGTGIDCALCCQEGVQPYDRTISGKGRDAVGPYDGLLKLVHSVLRAGFDPRTMTELPGADNGAGQGGRA